MAQNILYAFLIILCIVTIVNSARELHIFTNFIKLTSVLWIAFGIMDAFSSKRLSFSEWFVGGGIAFFGISFIFFNILVFSKNFLMREEESGSSVNNHDEYEMEIVDGEVVFDDRVSSKNLIPAIAKSSRKAKITTGSFVTNIDMPLSDWRTCKNIKSAHWHTNVNGKDVCEGK